MFPLGEYAKTEVRGLARDFGLSVHDKKASQDTCFVPDNDYRRFIRGKMKPGSLKPGRIIDREGEVVGRHDGIAFFTIGQRRGLGAHNKPVYVTSLQSDTDTVVIGEEKDLYRHSLIAGQASLSGREGIPAPMRVIAKIRYNHGGADASVVKLQNGTIEVMFDNPQRAIAPGQAVVLYDRETVAGGGWIC
jgi:tRNA-specific 2-thiouridylase